MHIVKKYTIKNGYHAKYFEENGARKQCAGMRKKEFGWEKMHNISGQEEIWCTGNGRKTKWHFISRFKN